MRSRAGSTISEEPEDDAVCCSIDPTTRSGRSFQILQMAGLPLLPGIGLVIYSLVDTLLAAQYYGKVQDVSTTIHHSFDVLSLAHALQQEADVVSFYLSSNESDLLGDISEIYKATENELSMLDFWPESESRVCCKTKQEFQTMLKLHRSELNSSAPAFEEITWYDSLVMQFIELIKTSLNSEDVRDVIRLQVSYKALIQTIGDLYMERIVGSQYFLQGHLSSSEYFIYIQNRVLAKEHLGQARRFHEFVHKLFVTWEFSNKQFINSLQAMEDVVQNNTYQSPDSSDALEYYNKTTQFTETVREFKKKTAKEIQTILDSKKSGNVTIMAANSLIVFVICVLVAPFITYSAAHTTSNLHTYSSVMERKSVELRKEKRKSDHIINQMLPKSVSNRLRKGEKVEAESYHSATVFFSDIADFSDIQTHSAPMQIVSFLNDFFNFMDDHVDRYDVYKVETIGCVYMIVSGLPNKNGFRHVTEIARLSLELISAVDNFKISHMPDVKVRLRIGIHTGPCVAGVVGNKAPRYCLFGDTVNTAARMQTNCEAQKIHITKSTFDALLQIKGYRMKERGTLEIKGKGKMFTYWLLGREVAPPPPETTSSVSNKKESAGFNIYQDMEKKLKRVNKSDRDCQVTGSMEGFEP